VVEDGDFFGVGGPRCAKIAHDCSFYDLNRHKKPQVKPTTPEDIRRLVDQYHPSISVGDIFAYVGSKKKYVYSNAWSGSYNNDDAMALMRIMFKFQGIYRFKMKFSELCKIYKTFNEPVTILNFGMYCSFDIFLTTLEFKDEAPWVYRVDDYEGFVDAIKGILKHKCEKLYRYVNNYMSSVSTKTIMVGRPFSIVYDMWPMMIGLKSVKDLVSVDGFSISDVVMADKDVEKFATEDFSAALKAEESDESDEDAEEPLKDNRTKKEKVEDAEEVQDDFGEQNFNFI
jgi:hypothetical protein